MRRLVMAAVAVAALGLSSTAFSHDASYRSRVTLRVENGVVFKGRVISQLHGCEVHRKVKLYRMESSGPDTFLQEDATDADGHYRIDTGPTFVDYYTRAARKVIHRPVHRHVCRAARSDVVQAT